jgi:hypothetical protein
LVFKHFMHVYMCKGWAIKSGPRTATFNDLLCFPLFSSNIYKIKNQTMKSLQFLQYHQHSYSYLVLTVFYSYTKHISTLFLGTFRWCTHLNNILVISVAMPYILVTDM